MKIKYLSTIMILSFTASMIFSEEVDTDIPPLGQVTEIHIALGIAEWRASFYPDKGARLNFAGNPGHMSNARVENATFEGLYNLLIPHLKRGRSNHTDTLSVSLGIGVPYYLDDREVMRTIMYGLLGKVQPFKSFNPIMVDGIMKYPFEDILKKKPLVPGDPPALREDGTPSYDKEKYANVAWWNGETEIPTLQPPTADEPSHGTLDVALPETENKPSTDAIAPSVSVTKAETTEKQSNSGHYIGVGMFLCVCALFLFIRHKRKTPPTSPKSKGGV